MVTDEQYKELQKRVESLEKKINQMSQQLAAFYMKQDAGFNSTNTSSQTSKRNKKDTTKYKLDGQLLCKRKLVLTCVKEFIKSNPDLSYNEIIDTFPDYIQGPLGVLKPASEAEKYSNAKKRYFFSDSDVVWISDIAYVICCQWDINNIERFLQVAKKLGFLIEPLNIYD